MLLVEKKRFPRWKVCGACLNGQALAVLESTGLGALVAGLGAIELKQFQARYRGRTAARSPCPSERRFPERVSMPHWWMPPPNRG